MTARFSMRFRAHTIGSATSAPLRPCVFLYRPHLVENAETQRRGGRRDAGSHYNEIAPAVVGFGFGFAGSSFSREGLLSFGHRENETERQPLGEQRNQPA